MPRPLEGVTVVVTRPRARAAGLTRSLRRLGATVLSFPTIRIADPEDSTALLDAVRSLSAYEWVVLTSVSGVERLLGAMADAAVAPEALASRRLAAIGPATARALERFGAPADVVPESYRAEALADAIQSVAGDGGLRGVRVLLARAADARPVLADRLRAAGAQVHEVKAYRTLSAPPPRSAVRRALAGGTVDWVTFTSPSTVRHFTALAGAHTGGARIAAIGPITAAAVRRAGLSVDAVAEEYTASGLVRALVGAEAAIS